MNRATCVQRIVSDGPTNCAARPLSSLGLQRLVVAASPVLVHRNVGVRAERGTGHGIIRWTSAGRPSHERRSTPGFQGSLPRAARGLESPSRTDPGCLVPRRPLLRRPRPDPGPPRDGPAPPNRRAIGAAGGSFLRRQSSVTLSADPDVSRPRPAGTVPRKRGPKAAHKCTDEVLAFVRAHQSPASSLTLDETLIAIREHLGIRLHRRTLERQLAALGKKPGRSNRPSEARPLHPST